MSPPVPKPPPASALSGFSCSPPDFMSPIRQFDADGEARQYVFQAWSTPEIHDKFKLCHRALKKFPFCVDAYNYIANLYVHHLCENDALDKGLQAYEYALECARVVWPGIDDREDISWGSIPYRPFMKALHGLAVVHLFRGEANKAIEGLRFLLRVNPGDNQGCRKILFEALIQAGEYEEADKAAAQYSKGRESREADICWGFVLIDFAKHKQGNCTEKDLHETLIRALESNHHVVPLLIGDIPLPPTRPSYIAPGSMDEAASYVLSTLKTWQRVPGDILGWLRDLRARDGKKPSGDGFILFQLLKKGRIMVELKDKTVEVTSRVGAMRGIAVESFRLAPGMKEHSEHKIVCYQFTDTMEGDPFISFSYEDVQSVPFWSILDASDKFGDDSKKKHHCDVCYEDARLKCSACGVIWYCSRECQQKGWKGKGRGLGTKHKVMCPKYQKMREKIILSRVSLDPK